MIVCGAATTVLARLSNDQVAMLALDTKKGTRSGGGFWGLVQNLGAFFFEDTFEEFAECPYILRVLVLFPVVACGHEPMSL